MTTEDNEARKLRIAKRIALVLGILVVLIFAVAGFLAYVHFAYDRPASEVLMGDDEDAEQP